MGDLDERIAAGDPLVQPPLHRNNDAKGVKPGEECSMLRCIF